MDDVADYLQDEKKQEQYKNLGIVLISGKLCQFYRISFLSSDTYKTELLSSFEEKLPNKHRRGGQSSARFGRIHDQTVERYIKKIVEHVEKTYRPLHRLIFAGPADIKNKVAQQFSNSCFVLDTSEIHPTQTIVSVLESAKEKGWISKFLSAPMDQAIFKFEDALVQNPDLLVFGEAETKTVYEQGLLNYLFISKEVEEFKSAHEKTRVIRIDKSHEFIKRFGTWSGILYFQKSINEFNM